MKQKHLSFKQRLLVAATLFGMFFGAGNLIFPVHLGQLAGRNLLPAMTGFILTAVGIPFEMHLFPEGVHGLAMADGCNDLAMDLPHVAQWGTLCAQWLEQQGL